MRKFPALVLIVAVLLLSLPVSEVRAADESGGIFLAHFDDNTQNVRDGNSGTSSGVTFGSAKFDNGAVFEGSDYLYYGASGNISKSAGTVEFWYKPSFAFSGSSEFQIIFMHDVNSQNLGWLSYIGVWTEATAGNKTHLVAEIKVDSAGVGQTLTDTSSTSWDANELHHVAVTWDSSAFRLYTDGTLRDEVVSPVLLDVDRNSIFIGNDMFFGSNSARGTIDEFLITNNVRSASDIASDYAASSAFSIATSPAAAAADTTAPSISDISVGSITKTTTTVSWTTDENSDSAVEFGTSTSYGKTISQEDDSVTSHSITLTGLSYGTTYHYQVKSTDGSNNNTATSSDNSFTTVDLDRVPPKVAFDAFEKVQATSSAKITGSATDNQSGVAILSYTLDGITFVPMEETGRFTIELELEDANYRLQVKAVDNEGNVELSSPLRFVIDTLPPHVGGTSFFLGHQKLFPNEAGTLVVSQGSKLSVVMSVIGGPTMVQVKTSEGIQSLTRITGTNLWKGEVSFENAGDFDIEVISKDGAGNEVTQSVGKVNVLPKGSVVDGDGNAVEGAEVSIFTKIENPASFVKEEWQLWDAQVFNQENPQTTDQTGSFYYLLPQGTYQLVVKGTGFRDFVSIPFTLENVATINPTVVLEKAIGISLFGKQFSLPWFLDILAKESEITLGTTLDDQVEELGIGEQATDFSLPATLGGEMSLKNFTGRKALLTFWATWDPSSIEQIAILDKLEEPENVILLPVAFQESKESVRSFLSRGGYLINSLVDENGELLESYQILALPQHYLISEDGIIRKVRIGALSEEEVLGFIQ